MSGLSIFEFDALVEADAASTGAQGVGVVPAQVFGWLED